MINLKRILALSSFALFTAAAPNAHAMLPACLSASSDSDGDGYGWENNASCLVGATTAADTATSSNSNTGIDTNSGLPVCASAASDSDGDGYGWENNASCLVTAATSNGGSAVVAPAPAAPAAPAGGPPACVSASSDPDGDGYGWENNDTCLVTAATGSGATSGTGTGLISDDGAGSSSNNISDDAGSATSNGISDDAGSATSNGISDDAGSATSDGGSTDNGSTAGDTGIINNDGGSFSSGDGGAVIRTTSLPVTATRSVTTSANGGDHFATEQVGDFILMQNAWRASRAAPGYEWSQTIQTNTNGVPVGWTYDWGPGVPGASGRASDDFYVRTYPELIYGIKDEFRTSASKAEIGFPVRVDEMPNIQIDYSFSAPQFGTARTVDASVTSRFPNGSTISGERNVAAESFLYAPTNGVCDDNLDVNRSNGSNHIYEVMVWLDSGAERLPAASRDFVTTVFLRGAEYKVYTKSDDNRYIAFVAQNPQTSGTIFWNDYLDWARQNAHQVSSLFGANAESVQIQDDWCVANIIVGTEIFWGAGSFDLFDWTITQRQ